MAVSLTWCVVVVQCRRSLPPALTHEVFFFALLVDAEVAAIAVISSLVFSILLSLTVFLVQRKHR